jgi:hypothetical protein
MQIPSVMFCEMALDMLKRKDAALLDAELKEFNQLGPGRFENISKVLIEKCQKPDGTAVAGMDIGYLIGLETARALLMMNVEARKAGVDI